MWTSAGLFISCLLAAAILILFRAAYVQLRYYARAMRGFVGQDEEEPIHAEK